MIYRFNFVCDDAFITFRYARNLADGLGLRFNAGETPPVEGYSEFLWAILMAGVERLGWDVLFWSRAISIASAAGLVLLIARIAERAMRLDAIAALYTGIFLAALPPITMWATGGLATMPFAFLFLAAYERLIAGMKPHGIQAGILALAAALMRADGAFFCALLAIAVLIEANLKRDRALLRGVILMAVIVVVGVTVHLAWRGWYYGDYLPNTARAKVAISINSITRGFTYLAAFMLVFPATIITVVSAAYARPTSLRPLFSTCLVIVLGTAAYTVMIGGDHMAMYRFFVPALPFLALMLGMVLHRLHKRPYGRTAAGVVAGVFSISVLLPAFDTHLVPASFRDRFNFRWQSRRPFTEFQKWDKMCQVTEKGTSLGKGLARITKPSESLVAGAIGALGYYSRLTIYDQFGLVCPEVARSQVPRLDLPPGHEKFVPREYFLKYRPTYLEAALVEVDAPGAGEGDFVQGEHHYLRKIVPLPHQEGVPPGLALSLLQRSGP
jgi:arabinofuranosyltransferase